MDPLCGNHISISPTISVSFVTKTGTNLQDVRQAVEDWERYDEISANPGHAAQGVGVPCIDGLRSGLSSPAADAIMDP